MLLKGEANRAGHPKSPKKLKRRTFVVISHPDVDKTTSPKG
jgi:peptide subunit release factor RF-3